MPTPHHSPAAKTGIRLYIDEDSQSRSLVAGLRAHGIDVLTAAEAEMLGVSDEMQLAYAAGQQRVLFTFNVGDFCRLHAQWMRTDRTHFGIVTSEQLQFSVGERLRRLRFLVEQAACESFQNRLEFLSNWRPHGDEADRPGDV